VKKALLLLFVLSFKVFAADSSKDRAVAPSTASTAKIDAHKAENKAKSKPKVKRPEEREIEAKKAAKERHVEPTKK